MAVMKSSRDSGPPSRRHSNVRRLSTPQSKTQLQLTLAPPCNPFNGSRSDDRRRRASCYAMPKPTLVVEGVGRSRSHTNLGPKEEEKASGGGERLQTSSSRRGSDAQQGGGEGEMLKAKPTQISSRSSSRRGSYTTQVLGGGEGLQAKPNQISSRSSSRRGSYIAQAQGGEGLQAKPNQYSTSRRASVVQQGGEGETLKATPNPISSRSSSRRGSDALLIAEEEKRSYKGSTNNLEVTDQDHHIV